MNYCIRTHQRMSRSLNCTPTPSSIRTLGSPSILRTPTRPLRTRVPLPYQNRHYQCTRPNRYTHLGHSKCGTHRIPTITLQYIPSTSSNSSRSTSTSPSTRRITTTAIWVSTLISHNRILKRAAWRPTSTMACNTILRASRRSSNLRTVWV
jgi:hypothetical protein